MNHNRPADYANKMMRISKNFIEKNSEVINLMTHDWYITTPKNMFFLSK